MYYRAEAAWNIFSDKPHLDPQYDATIIGWGETIDEAKEEARWRIRCNDLHPDHVTIYEYESRQAESFTRVVARY